MQNKLAQTLNLQADMPKIYTLFKLELVLFKMELVLFKVELMLCLLELVRFKPEIMPFKLVLVLFMLKYTGLRTLLGIIRAVHTEVCAIPTGPVPFMLTLVIFRKIGRRIRLNEDGFRKS